MPGNDSLKVFTITAFLFAFLYMGAYINPYTEELSKLIRVILIAFSVLASIFIFARERRVNRKSTFILLFIFCLCLLYFPFNSELPSSFIWALLASLSAMVIAYLISATECSRKIQIYDLTILMVLLYLAVLFLASAITFYGFLPVIVFVPDEFSDYFLYSQGVTKIFSVGVLAAVFKVVNGNLSAYQKSAFGGLALIFFILSLAGGSRGEAIVCVLVVAILFCNSWLSLLMTALGVICILMFITAFADIESFERINSISRILSLYEDSSFGYRDVLLLEAFELLGENPKCVVLGCGFMFFQNYYERGFFGHPHNFIVEFLIVFGLPLLIIAIGLVALFVVRNYKSFSNNEKFLMMLSLYFFGISLKSGTLVGDALLYGSFFPVLFTVRRTPTAGGRKYWDSAPGGTSWRSGFASG